MLRVVVVKSWDWGWGEKEVGKAREIEALTTGPTVR